MVVDGEHFDVIARDGEPGVCDFGGLQVRMRGTASGAPGTAVAA